MECHSLPVRGAAKAYCFTVSSVVFLKVCFIVLTSFTVFSLHVLVNKKKGVADLGPLSLGGSKLKVNW